MAGKFADQILWSRNLPEMGETHSRAHARLSEIDAEIERLEQELQAMRASGTRALAQHNREVQAQWTSKEIAAAIDSWATNKEGHTA